MTKHGRTAERECRLGVVFAVPDNGAPGTSSGCRKTRSLQTAGRGWETVPDRAQGPGRFAPVRREGALGVDRDGALAHGDDRWLGLKAGVLSAAAAEEVGTCVDVPGWFRKKQCWQGPGHVVIDIDVGRETEARRDGGQDRQTGSGLRRNEGRDKVEDVRLLGRRKYTDPEGRRQEFELARE